MFIKNSENTISIQFFVYHGWTVQAGSTDGLLSFWGFILPDCWNCPDYSLYLIINQSAFKN